MSPSKKKPSTDVDNDGKVIDLNPLLSPEESHDFTSRIRAAETKDEKDKVRDERNILRATRKEQRSEIRAEIRELGLAWDQRLGDFIASLVNEAEAKALLNEAIMAVASEVSSGADLGKLADDVIELASENADEVFEFQRIPIIGGVLERYDDLFFKWLASKWRDEIIAKLAKLVKRG